MTTKCTQNNKNLWYTLVTKYLSNGNPSVIYEQLSTYQHHHFVSFLCQPFSKSVTNNPQKYVKKSHTKRCNFMQIILPKWSQFHRLWFQTMHKQLAFCKKWSQKRMQKMQTLVELYFTKKSQNIIILYQ